MNETSEQRTKILSVRLTPSEWKTLAERAGLCGSPTSRFVRETALGHRPKARAGRVENLAVYQLARIGNNLNQLTRAANAQRHVELSRRLKDVLQQLIQAIARIR